MGGQRLQEQRRHVLSVSPTHVHSLISPSYSLSWSSYHHYSYNNHIDHIQLVADSNRRRLRSSSSMQLAIRRTRLSTVGDRAFPVAGGWMRPLEQSAIRCHVSSNAHCFSESPQDTPLLKIISCITFNCFSVPISYTVDSSGLAVFT